MKAYRFPEYETPLSIGKKVSVIGGGNVALDAARSALRLGSEVIVIYRRTKELMPARNEEIKNAEEEGIKFVFLAVPARFYGDNSGRVKQIQCLKTKISKSDSKDERRVLSIAETEFLIEADTVIVAIGQKPNSLIVNREKKINLTNKGAGIPDGGFFTADQFRKQKDPEPVEGQLPSRGALEVKGTSEDVEKVADSEQVGKYWTRYRQVLVTNLRDFVLVGTDSKGQQSSD